MKLGRSVPEIHLHVAGTLSNQQTTIVAHCCLEFASSSSSSFSVMSLGFTNFGEIFAYMTVFPSICRGGQIPSSRMVHTGFVFVAGIHPSRT